VTKRLDVITGVKALAQATFPGIDVLGLEGEEAAPDRVPANGRIIVRAGDPGAPEIDLSPVMYNYSHEIPVEIEAYKTSDPDLTGEQVVDSIVARFSAAIEADRTLGGLVEYLDGYAPATGDIYVAGATPVRAADLVLIATYSTPHPL
jgi:hypothetical protein